MRSGKICSRLLLLLVLGAIAFSFAPALRGTFIWDDTTLILNNKYIKEKAYLTRNI
jgi:hypothetical protein